MSHPLGCFQSSLHSITADGVQYLFGNRFIRAKATKRNTSAFTVIEMGALAVVPEGRMSDASIRHVQHPVAAAAS